LNGPGGAPRRIEVRRDEGRHTRQPAHRASGRSASVQPAQADPRERRQSALRASNSKHFDRPHASRAAST
jgi:hypothetical protein